MLELTAKLRAKFPRRHSGGLSVASKRSSSISTKTTATSTSPSTATSENGAADDALTSHETAASHAARGVDVGAQNTVKQPAAKRDRLRQSTRRTQAAAQQPTADVIHASAGTDDSHAASARMAAAAATGMSSPPANKTAVQSSAPGAVCVAVSVAAVGSDCAASAAASDGENATGEIDSLPRAAYATMHSANATESLGLPQPVALHHQIGAPLPSGKATANATTGIGLNGSAINHQSAIISKLSATSNSIPASAAIPAPADTIDRAALDRTPLPARTNGGPATTITTPVASFPADLAAHLPANPPADPTAEPSAVRRHHLTDLAPPATAAGPDSPASPNQSAANAASNGVEPDAAGRLLRVSHSPHQPTSPPRRQSLLLSRQNTLIRTLLGAAQTDDAGSAGPEAFLPTQAAMVTRKVWVKRPGGSPTLVTISEDDLVDDVRDLILRKYANSLGRQFDAPDLVLKIVPREPQRQERVLGPEEPMARNIDAYYPGGQTIDEALLIDAPARRTPRASPRAGPPHAQHLTSVIYEDNRPLESSTDYFGPGATAHAPALPANTATTTTGTAAHQNAISVLHTGQVPPIPSPGGGRSRAYRERPDRPRLGRQHTSSPNVANVPATAANHTAANHTAANHTATTAAVSSPTHGTPPVHPPTQIKSPRLANHTSGSPDQTGTAAQAPPAPPPAPPLPTPPAPEAVTGIPPAPAQRVATPPPRVASPRPAATTAASGASATSALSRTAKKKKAETPLLSAGMLSGRVPPINILIVEDNIINLRLLEAFVKRLRVRWQTAMNGREAVTKWRAGGFHLVLMDIQLPVMSGLEATREIRRLERLNSIGAFSTVPGSDEAREENPNDKLPNRELFKSPVIIVALTASSLQSDRHEALAAGCNDFLTKPVTYLWLERKVMEWGCMQALIDYDGWRKWKSYEEEVASKKQAAAGKNKKNRLSLTVAPATASSEAK